MPSALSAMDGKVTRSPAARASILTTAAALVIALAFGAFWLDARLGLRMPSGLRMPGIAVLACGLALIVWAEATLLRIARSTGGFGDAPGTLVTAGPYGHTRNPIYIGAFGVLVGLSLWRASPSLLIAASAFLPLMHVFVTRLEEPATRRRLGGAYDDYARRVPRWIPRLQPPRGIR